MTWFEIFIYTCDKIRTTTSLGLGLGLVQQGLTEWTKWKPLVMVNYEDNTLHQSIDEPEEDYYFSPTTSVSVQQLQCLTLTLTLTKKMS